MNFEKLLISAKNNDESTIYQLIEMYKPLLLKESIINEVFDEDLYQVLWVTLINCIKKFQV